MITELWRQRQPVVSIALEGGGSRHEIPPLAGELLAIVSCYERGSVFSKTVSPSKSSRLSGRPHIQNIREVRIVLGEDIKGHRAR